MKKLTAQQIVEIRKIEDEICIAATRGDIKAVLSGYKKINKIRA